MRTYCRPNQEPVHDVEHQIAIGDGRTENKVGGEVGTADHDDTAGFVAGADGSGGADDERAAAKRDENAAEERADAAQRSRYMS